MVGITELSDDFSTASLNGGYGHINDICLFFMTTARFGAMHTSYTKGIRDSSSRVDGHAILAGGTATFIAYMCN